MKKQYGEPASKGWQLWIIAIIFVLILSVLVHNSWGANWTRYQVVYNPSADSARVLLKNGLIITDVDTLSTLPDSVLHTMDSTKSYSVEVYCWYPGYADEFSYFDYSIGAQEIAVDLSADSVYVKGGSVDSNRTEGSGSGDYVLTVLAYDTTNSDSVSGVNITIQDASGTPIRKKTTLSNGLITFPVDTGTYTLIGEKAWYTFPESSYTVTGNDTIQFSGYLFNPQSLVVSDSDICTLYGYIGDGIYPIQLAVVTATRSENAYDTCNNIMIINRIQSDETNSDGIWGIPVLRSKCLDKQNYYDLKVYLNGSMAKSKSILVPDSPTHMVVF